MARFMRAIQFCADKKLDGADSRWRQRRVTGHDGKMLTRLERFLIEMVRRKDWLCPPVIPGELRIGRCEAREGDPGSHHSAGIDSLGPLPSRRCRGARRG